MNVASRWDGRIVLAPGLLLYVGPGAAAASHSHHAVQLVWTRSRPFSVVLAGRPVSARSVLVPARLEHAFDAHGEWIALVLVERHGALGAALDALARSPSTRDIAADLASVGFPRTDGTTPEELFAWCKLALGALGVSATPQPLSRLSRQAIEYVEANLDGRPRLGGAASQAGVSETRLTHVFSREVGIPFRRFVLWARIKGAVAQVAEGASLTEAAAAAGFSDSAHFARTFRANFGLAPSVVLSRVETVRTAW